MGRFGRGAALAMLATAAAQWSLGAVTLDIPDVVATPGSTFDFAAVFSVTPAAPIDTIGYQVALKITGPDNGLTITGASAAALYNGQAGSFEFVPADNVDAGIPNSDVYAFTDFMMSGKGTIQDGSTFATFTGQLAAGASGPYQVSWYLVDDGVYKSMILDGSGSELAGVAFNGGMIAVPEPFCLGMLAASSPLMLVRRRK